MINQFTLRTHASPSSPPQLSMALVCLAAIPLANSQPMVVVNKYDDDLFRFSFGDPGHCVGEAPKCGDVDVIKKNVSQRFVLAPGADYLSVGGGIKTTKDGSVCQTWLSDNNFCAAYDGSVDGDCARLSNAICTRVGSNPITYELSATIDRYCDTLPYADCTLGTSKCCGTNACIQFDPTIAETKCWPNKVIEAATGLNPTML